MGGRVCIYLRSSINYKLRQDLIPSELEAVCVEINNPHSRPFLVTTIYRPPNSTHDFFESFEKFIKMIDDENKEIYILGDLNCDMLKSWIWFGDEEDKIAVWIVSIVTIN